MFILESWILTLIMLAIFLFGAIGIIGWILEGERLSKQVEENKKLHYENAQLRQRLAHKNALENIKAANEYYEAGKKKK